MANDGDGQALRFPALWGSFGAATRWWRSTANRAHACVTSPPTRGSRSNFDGDGHGGNVVVFSGTAHVDDDALAADANPAWLKKYAAQIKEFGMTPALYAARFGIPIRIRLARLDGR